MISEKKGLQMGEGDEKKMTEVGGGWRVKGRWGEGLEGVSDKISNLT